MIAAPATMHAFETLEQAMVDPDLCVFPLRFFAKYDDGNRLVAAPTLSMAITETLPSIAPSRAIFGARRMPEDGRSYDCYEIIFPDTEDRPTDGYVEWGVRKSVTFDDEIEIFDASDEFRTAEGLLRYRAQDLGEDEKSLEIIRDGVVRYIQAFDNMALWDPKASTDITAGFDELFQRRDWTRFVPRVELEVSEVTIANVEFLPYDDDLALIRFDYANGADVGREMEYLKLHGERPTVVRHGWSALRSAIPAFKGRQLNQVHDALQRAVDAMVGEEAA
ncbi:hypothetical protein ACC786_14370 [Rhizobium ruizarguesonis]|uniref:hypothetical protein n=1 Tax=Rhizobium ruizarguesonis TaxID=2081791 RepID=UPI00103065D3|nr:hypothetical protein [Rhizobium ruizarguesonis]TAT91899.1 hypothetical protein ELI55_36420 [Rhizobium ruizarguesonis]